MPSSGRRYTYSVFAYNLLLTRHSPFCQPSIAAPKIRSSFTIPCSPNASACHPRVAVPHIWSSSTIPRSSNGLYPINIGSLFLIFCFRLESSVLPTFSDLSTSRRSSTYSVFAYNPFNSQGSQTYHLRVAVPNIRLLSTILRFLIVLHVAVLWLVSHIFGLCLQFSTLSTFSSPPTSALCPPYSVLAYNPTFFRHSLSGYFRVAGPHIQALPTIPRSPNIP